MVKLIEGGIEVGFSLLTSISLTGERSFSKSSKPLDLVLGICLRLIGLNLSVSTSSLSILKEEVDPFFLLVKLKL
jgi:hypothetical protein